MKKNYLAFAVAALCSVGAPAQVPELTVSVGAKDGTYYQMFNQLNTLCGKRIATKGLLSTGSLQNLTRMIDENSAHAGFVQLDILHARAQTEDLGDLKMLFPLHPEEVHFITPRVSPIKVNKTMGFGGEPLQMASIKDLSKRVVVAHGGSVQSARIISSITGLGFAVQEVKDFNDGMAAINSGAAAALLTVGGSPLKDTVGTLNTNHRLLPVTDDMMEKLKVVYNPATVVYNGMGSTPTRTFATNAAFIVRNYQVPKYQTALNGYRNCMIESLPELRATLNFHKKWRQVPDTPVGKWPAYQ